jgi:hypothetical protein
MLRRRSHSPRSAQGEVWPHGQRPGSARVDFPGRRTDFLPASKRDGVAKCRVSAKCRAFPAGGRVRHGTGVARGTDMAQATGRVMVGVRGVRRRRRTSAPVGAGKALPRARSTRTGAHERARPRPGGRGWTADVLAAGWSPGARGRPPGRVRRHAPGERARRGPAPPSSSAAAVRLPPWSCSVATSQRAQAAPPWPSRGVFGTGRSSAGSGRRCGRAGRPCGGTAPRRAPSRAVRTARPSPADGRPYGPVTARPGHPRTPLSAGLAAGCPSPYCPPFCT